MKKSRIENLFTFIILFNTLNASCFGCFRSKRIADGELSTVTPNNFVNRTSINRTLVEIASTKTCNTTQEPTKEEVFCYHKGKCQSKLVPLNETHYERVIFCLCANVRTRFFILRQEISLLI